MSKKLLIGLLGLSVLFNIFVLLGFAQGRRGGGAVHRVPQSDDAVIKNIAIELKLDDSQERHFGELRAGMREQASALDEHLQLLRLRLNAEMREELPDVDRVRALVDNEADLHRQRRQAGAAMFRQFVDVLSPQQRRAMSHRFDRVPRHGVPPHILRRYDANRNKTLEIAELDAALDQAEARRRGFTDRPALPWQRFDADRDGKLNADEQTRFDEATRHRETRQ